METDISRITKQWIRTSSTRSSCSCFICYFVLCSTFCSISYIECCFNTFYMTNTLLTIISVNIKTCTVVNIFCICFSIFYKNKRKLCPVIRYFICTFCYFTIVIVCYRSKRTTCKTCTIKNRCIAVRSTISCCISIYTSCSSCATCIFVSSINVTTNLECTDILAVKVVIIFVINLNICICSTKVSNKRNVTKLWICRSS